MKQNSTKNMILSHLKDIKAKIEQKSINNMKLPFEGPFKNKYAGRSPERILGLNSVRLVYENVRIYLKGNEDLIPLKNVSYPLRSVVHICLMLPCNLLGLVC